MVRKKMQVNFKFCIFNIREKKIEGSNFVYDFVNFSIYEYIANAPPQFTGKW